MMHNTGDDTRRYQHQLLSLKQIDVSVGDTWSRRKMERFVDNVNLVMKQQREKISKNFSETNKVGGRGQKI
jgi:CO dehydrogenase/acetyl-CoA synthase delta subunit